MSDTVSRLRYLAHEVRILPATEANIQRLNDLVQEAMDVMADSIEETSRQMKSFFDQAAQKAQAPSAGPAPTPAPEPAVLKEADDVQPTQAPEAAS